MRVATSSAWGIQTGPFALIQTHLPPKNFQLFHFYSGRPILITPVGQESEMGNHPTLELNERGTLSAGAKGIQIGTFD